MAFGDAAKRARFVPKGISMAKPPPHPPRLKVLSGAWIQSPAWLTFPKLISARDPMDRTKPARFRIAVHDAIKAAESRRRQPAYDLWSNVIGQAPPVPHNTANANEGLLTLWDAHALFKGLNRPWSEDDNGENKLAYILKPAWFFAYDPRPPVLLTSKDSFPIDLVFAVYATLDTGWEQSPTKGVVTHWQAIPADSEDENLPEDWKKRYAENCGRMSSMSGLPPSATNLTTPYAPVAVYYEEADSVEYIRADVPAVYKRIDNLLTLIYDMKHRENLIGFRVKGFKNFYLKELKPSLAPLDQEFLALVSVIEKAFSTAGDGIFERHEREVAYAKARNLAQEDGVALRDLPRAC